METDSLPPRWGEYARRLPSSLEDLRGPAAGEVELPLHVAWSGRRVYDVSQEDQRLVLYALLLAEAQREDLPLSSGSCTASRWSACGPGCGGCWVRTPGGNGSGSSSAGSQVSLDGLPPAHLRVLLDGLPVFERYGLLLAGGYAFRAHEILHRPSQDLDFATRDGTPLPEIAAQVQLAFQRAGYGVRLAEATPRYARLVLQLPGSGEELEMDLLKEALEPRWVTVRITPAASVRAVSLEDTVGLKARAWHDRFVIRDIIDLHAVAGTFSYADLENLARRHDPDLDLEAIQDHLAGVSVFTDEDFAEYGLDERRIADLRNWVTGWYGDLALRLAADLADDDL
jgi:hypothetical protein